MYRLDFKLHDCRDRSYTIQYTEGVEDNEQDQVRALLVLTYVQKNSNNNNDTY